MQQSENSVAFEPAVLHNALIDEHFMLMVFKNIFHQFLPLQQHECDAENAVPNGVVQCRR